MQRKIFVEVGSMDKLVYKILSGGAEKRKRVATRFEFESLPIELQMHVAELMSDCESCEDLKHMGENQNQLYQACRQSLDCEKREREELISFLKSSEFRYDDHLTDGALNPEEVDIHNLEQYIRSITRLDYVRYQTTNVASLPGSIGNLTGLTTLKMKYSENTSLPYSIGNLTSLEYLECLQNYRLTSLPDSIGNLTGLTGLTLVNNTQLTSLPDSIGNLTNLKLLWIEKNPLTSLPDSITNLTNLHDLRVTGGQLAHLPESIGDLTALQTLILNGNQLTSLPDSVGNLTLSTLRLQENRLSSLPDSLTRLTSLSQLFLWGNDDLPESLPLPSLVNGYDVRRKRPPPPPQIRFY